MSNKFNKKELLKIAESGLADMSCEQIKQLIQKESEKDYGQINTDFIDLCFDMLEMKQNNEAFNIKLVKKNSNKAAIRKVLLFAAVFMMFVVTTLTVSAQLKLNIPQEIAQLINGNAELDDHLENADTTANGYLLLETDLAKQIADYGITPVTLPEELIKENCTIIQIKYESSDEVWKKLTIDFNYNNQEGLLYIDQRSEGIEYTGVWSKNNIKSGQMININGMDVLVFEQEKCCSIVYQDNLTTYDITLYCDLKTAIKIAKSIK